MHYGKYIDIYLAVAKKKKILCCLNIVQNYSSCEKVFFSYQGIYLFNSIKCVSVALINFYLRAFPKRNSILKLPKFYI